VADKAQARPQFWRQTTRLSTNQKNLGGKGVICAYTLQKSDILFGVASAAFTLWRTVLAL
jgi:hypothetical protein